MKYILHLISFVFIASCGYNTWRPTQEEFNQTINIAPRVEMINGDNVVVSVIAYKSGIGSYEIREISSSFKVNNNGKKGHGFSTMISYSFIGGKFKIGSAGEIVKTITSSVVALSELSDIKDNYLDYEIDVLTTDGMSGKFKGRIKL